MSRLDEIRARDAMHCDNADLAPPFQDRRYLLALTDKLLETLVYLAEHYTDYRISISSEDGLMLDKARAVIEEARK